MKDPGSLFRILYQHLKASSNLPRLQPRPLQAKDILAGTAEFVVTKGQDLDGGGWCSGGLLIPRAYAGYVAVHYAVDTDQHETFGDEAALHRALVTFERLPAVMSEPAFRSLGYTPSDWFLNPEPTKAERPPVLTLAFDWRLELDLTLQEGPPP